ncbi:hypothetical protein GCM10009785_29050 [Brooklawnia cerclae]|uniref:Fe-S cluster protein YjdI/predicted GNAT family acetyltransferase n=1 Tax=Brooklawnia cerclae TaxID=349934 RepID=A0ABX0SFW7_9ACTN|nr:GNAT family N-acetyltransferase [Brooklawnia cerclae]NIH56804.1 putative Fe-S cluster protein YjdI/predicted GNAT family acetyltransferase [Brooklawnia cerclae]
MARKVYYGPLVDVSFDGDVCRHAAECVRGMPEVFNTSKRPWIDPVNADTAERADYLREVIGRCPSGALVVEEHPAPAPASTPSCEVSVIDAPEASRFEARIDGVLAGFAEYQLTDQLVVFTHTEVDPAFEGRGVGSAIARYALDKLRSEGTHKALPLCPFIKGWIERHPDYLDITYGARPAQAQ